MRTVAARRGSDHDAVGPRSADRDHAGAHPDPSVAVVAVPGLVTGPDPATGRPDHPQGLPRALRRGIETLSGLAMDDVRVHRDSPRPAALGALAYTEGTEIHLGPGQDRHLPHEAWHVVQQKQGRVRGRRQAAATRPIDQDLTLEREADVMGARAARGDPGGSAPAPEVVAPTTPAIQLMKVGVEITFSNDDLLPMSLSKKAYVDVCGRLGKKNPPPFDAYTESIGKEYFKPWIKYVRKPVADVPAPVGIAPGESPKGSPWDLNTVFTYDLKTATSVPSVPSGSVGPETTPSVLSKEPAPPSDGPVVPVLPGNVLKQEVGEPTPSTPEAKSGEKAATDALPDVWWWDIDIDPACLEIRAMPIDHTLYAHPIVRGIIDTHIYGGAKKLGLRTGYGGEGGGHISVDLATGFGGDPLNVVKTMAWVELNKNEIDRDVALIDVIDNKNAPYLFHPGRGEPGLQALRTWLVQSLLNPKLRGQDRPDPGPARAPQPAPGQPEAKGRRREKKPSASERAAMAEQARLADLRGVPWNDHLVELGRILAAYLAVTPAKDDAGQQPGMFAELDDFEKLHYLAVNLQHTRTADREPHDEGDKALAERARRVEFRRLVSQRNVDELIVMINRVVGWIEAATLHVPEVLAKGLETAKSEILVQSAELMALNRSQARKVEKRDRGGS